MILIFEQLFVTGITLAGICYLAWFFATQGRSRIKP